MSTLSIAPIWLSRLGWAMMIVYTYIPGHWNYDLWQGILYERQKERRKGKNPCSKIKWTWIITRIILTFGVLITFTLSKPQNVTPETQCWYLKGRRASKYQDKIEKINTSSICKNWLFGIFSSNYDNLMSHHVPGPPDYDVVMTEQVPGLNGPKMLGWHEPTAPYCIELVPVAGAHVLLF